jgi:hypothetical protein
MSRPTVTVISPKGESSQDTIAVPNVFKVSHDLAWTERHGCWKGLQDSGAGFLQDFQQYERMSGRAGQSNARTVTDSSRRPSALTLSTPFTPA